MKDKFMELENKNNIHHQIVSHPLTKMVFEELFNNNGKLFNLYSDYTKQKIGSSLGLPLDIVKTITLGKASSGEFVIFSGDVFKGLKEDRYYQPISKKDGLVSTVAHNSKDGTIVEHGRVGRKMTSVLSFGIGVAHTISNLDMQNQLEEIKDAVDRIHRFQVSNRIGDLKSVYSTLQNWLDRMSKEGLTFVNQLKGQGIPERLDSLEHQFFEMAKSELESIINPAYYGRGIFGFIKHLNIFTKTPEQKAKEKLKVVFEDLEYLNYWESNLIVLYQGNLSPEQFAETCIRDVFVISIGVLGASTGQALIPVPILGALIGNFIGSTCAAIIFEGSKSIFLSFFIESGISFFNIVKQDYTIPREILEKCGFNLIRLNTIELDTIGYYRY